MSPAELLQETQTVSDQPAGTFLLAVTVQGLELAMDSYPVV